MTVPFNKTGIITVVLSVVVLEKGDWEEELRTFTGESSSCSSIYLKYLKREKENMTWLSLFRVGAMTLHRQTSHVKRCG